MRDQTTSIDGTALGYLGAGQDDAVSEGAKALQNNLLGLGGASGDYYTRQVDGHPALTTQRQQPQILHPRLAGLDHRNNHRHGRHRGNLRLRPRRRPDLSTGTSSNPVGYAAGYKAPAGSITTANATTTPQTPAGPNKTPSTKQVICAKRTATCTPVPTPSTSPIPTAYSVF